MTTFYAVHSTFSHSSQHMVANLAQQFQNWIQPIIAHFIESIELGVPRCVVTSEKKTQSCLVIVWLKKGLNYRHSFFKTRFTISSFDNIQYLKKFLDTIYIHWRFFTLHKMTQLKLTQKIQTIPKRNNSITFTEM